MKKRIQHTWFTLIELMVAMTIFAIIMVSVISIFIFSSQMSTRVELSRVMQENVKNVYEDIAEEVRKWKIIDTSTGVLPINNCVIPLTWAHSIVSPETGDKLCLAGDIEYAIWNKQSGSWSRVGNLDDCKDADEDDDKVCRVLKKIGAGDYFPLTNNRVAVENLEFRVSNETLPKVSIFMTVRSAYKKGLNSSLVQANTLQLQTTVSQRFIETR